ncbi:MAG: TrkH family potassium uptake protein, partial [candidate division Zixibacteria bacterium]|nr:TrkH family potassium uptake protein [candidate division Zixibacteria bacterium]
LLSSKPGQKIIEYFALGIAVGTILLMLPISAAGKPVAFIDALFTSTSAICVTGLTVLDTAKDFSIFGQVVILLLIQLGGLGIMTFATIFLVAAGARLPYLDRLGLSQSFGSETHARSAQLLKAVFITTVIVETLGALALYVQFRPQFPAGTAAYHAVFHSISGFCNAGFSTFSTSLEGFKSDSSILLTMALLIIVGGLGFAVIGETLDRVRNRKNRLSLHSKLCLTTTGVLIVAGAVIFLVLERSNAYQGSGLVERVVNACFQSVTARTCGFNTIPQAHLTDLSLLVTIVLMFIGACPGSTGGGVKTTTLAVISLLLFNRIKGRRTVAAFKRTISNDSVLSALYVFLLALLLIVAMLAVLMFIEYRGMPHSESQGWFMKSMFEVVSAFGTVGLSTGITPQLSFLGKFTLVVTMFIGRVGLLTLAYSVARPEKKSEIVYLDESVMVG